MKSIYVIYRVDSGFPVKSGNLENLEILVLFAHVQKYPGICTKK